MNTILSFGDWLVQRRTILGWTQQQLASEAHCSVSLISKLENNLRTPSSQMIDVLATTLEIHSAYQQLFFDAARGIKPVSVLPAPEYAAVAPHTSSTALPLFAPPRLLTPLIGREHEVAHLEQLLAQTTERLIVVTGTGGVGKTHLVHRVIHDLDGLFTHGIIWIDLAAIQDVALFPFLVARTMHLSHTTEHALRTAIERLLAHPGTLLILDNCEHLLPQLGSEIQHLLYVCPYLRIVATSRTVTHVQGEVLLRLEPFEVDTLAAATSIAAYQDHPSIALFLHCVAQRDIHLNLNAATLQDIATVCRTVDGLPLAIELAAARMGVFSPALLVQQLDRLFDLLTAPTLGRPDRQHTLYRTLTWSYTLLSTEAQHLFQCLGFVQTSTDIQTLAVLYAVHGSHDVLAVAQIIEHLLDASMIFYEDAIQPLPRYNMLYPLRVFARDRLTPSFHEQLVQRYVDYLLEGCATAREQQQHDQPWDTWKTWFEHEQVTLNIILKYLLTQQHALLLQVYTAVVHFWKLLDYWHEAHYWGHAIHQLLRQLDHGQQDQLQPPGKRFSGKTQLEFFCEYSFVLIHFYHYAEVVTLLEQAQSYGQDPQLSAVYGNMLVILSHAYIYTDQLSAAYTCLHSLLDAPEGYFSATHRSKVLFNLGCLERARGEDEAAFTYFEQALIEARIQALPLWVIQCLRALTYFAVDIGRIDQAAPLIEEGLILAQHVQYKSAIPRFYIIRGRMAALKEEYQLARCDFQAALALMEEAGNFTRINEILHSLAYIMACEGSLALAGTLYRTAQQLYYNVHPTYTEQATDVVEQGLLALAQQQLAPAEYQAWLAGDSGLTLEAAIALAKSVILESTVSDTV